jgi:hypothetical protein
VVTVEGSPSSPQNDDCLVSRLRNNGRLGRSGPTGLPRENDRPEIGDPTESLRNLPLVYRSIASTTSSPRERSREALVSSKEFSTSERNGSILG